MYGYTHNVALEIKKKMCEPPLPSAQFVGYTIENPLITGPGTTFPVVSPDNGSGLISSQK